MVSALTPYNGNVRAQELIKTLLIQQSEKVNENETDD